MDGSILHCFIYILDDRDELLSTLDAYQTKLDDITSTKKLQSEHHPMMVDWVEFTISNISMDLGLQIEEAIESLNQIVLFIGPKGLTDLRALKSGRLDNYLRSLLHDLELFIDFEVHFRQYDPIMKYCLNIWRNEAYQISDIGQLEELKFIIQSEQVQQIFEQRIAELSPQSDEDQDSLDEFF